MPELTITAPSSPNAAAAQGVQGIQGLGAADKMDADAAATATPATSAIAGGSDFAAILGRRLAHALPDADGKNCRNASLPQGEKNPSETQAGTAAIPDLSALLPALASLMSNPAATAAAPAGGDGAAATAVDALALATSATAAANDAAPAGTLPAATPPLPSALSLSAVAGGKTGESTGKNKNAAPEQPAGFAAAALSAAEAAAGKEIYGERIATTPTPTPAPTPTPIHAANQPQQPPQTPIQASTEALAPAGRDLRLQDVAAGTSAAPAASATPAASASSISIHAAAQEMQLHFSTESATSVSHELQSQETVAEISSASVAQLHAATQSQMHAAAAGATDAATRIDTPMGAPGWSQEVAQKVVWLAGRDESRAELTLNPPHLGRIEVTLTMNGDQTSALFVSASQAVRDALENSLPRLRETLADAGITLGQASVNADSSPNDDGGSGAPAGRRNAAEATPLRDATASIPWSKSGNGLIDTFV